jgi:hypothetical protein
LAFGADYHSDFVYLSKSSDDWNCVLIEIERPGYTFFKPGTNDFHRNFQKALEQINRWRAWFSNAANLTSFAETTVGMIRVPLSRNPTYPKYVLVYGRRIEYERSAIRRSLIRAQETDDFKIMTFDSLAEELESKHDLYVGVRHNEYIDIVSNVFLSESMFSSMPPDQIRIGEKLRANALATRQHWHHFSSREGRVMDIALPAVRRRPTTRNLSRAVLE